MPGQRVKDVSIDDMLAVNRSVERVLRGISKKEMILQYKLEDILDIPDLVPPED